MSKPTQTTKGQAQGQNVRMTSEDRHAESGCTDYLQHSADSCPHMREYTRDECEALANMVKAAPASRPQRDSI